MFKGKWGELLPIHRKRMKKSVSLVLILSLLLFALSGCGADYSGDERIGTYRDEETGAYTLVLQSNGKGRITHHSDTVLPTEEEIFFELRDGYLYVTGRVDNGAVIGKNEHYGQIEKVDGVYTVVLKSDVTGGLLGTFKQLPTQ